MPPRDAETLDALRRLAARDQVDVDGMADVLPEMDAHTRNLLVRTFWKHTLEELLFWTDEDWLAVGGFGPARLAVLRAHWPSPEAVGASTVGGWVEHAEMTSLAERR